MENNLYAKVQRPSQKKDRLLPVAVTAAAIIVIICIIPIVWSGKYQRDYWNYIGRLSDGTVYAYENDCLTVVMEGQSRKLAPMRGYDIFQTISNAGTGRVLRKNPEGSAAAVIDYGNGTMLSLWEIPAGKDSNEDRDTDIFLLLQDEKGRYGYIAWDILPSVIWGYCR